MLWELIGPQLIPRLCFLVYVDTVRSSRQLLIVLPSVRSMSCLTVLGRKLGFSRRVLSTVPTP